MAQPNFHDYLTLLNNLRQELQRLFGVEQKKVAAVQARDMAALNDCMKLEQAAALTLRGMEQQRDALLKTLGLEGVSLRELPQRCPPELKGETSQTVEALLRDYAVLKSIQSPAQDLLERELKTVNDILEERGMSPEPDGRKPSSGGQQPSPSFHTDFRA